MINEADYAFSLVTMILAPLIHGATIGAFIWWCVMLFIWFFIRLSGYLPYCGFRPTYSYAADDTDLMDPTGDISRVRMIHLPFCGKRFQAYVYHKGKGVWEDIKINRFALNGGIRGIRNVLSGTTRHQIQRGSYVAIELADGRVLVNTNIREDADLIFYRQLFRWYNHNLSPIHQTQPRSKGWYLYSSWL